MDDNPKQERDHRKIGKALDLFVFSDLVGPGLPLWTPRGTLLRNLLDDFVWELRQQHGYERVEIPHITKKDLYVRSGHWDKFEDELFRITTREGHEFAMKPMNCPHHIEIFKRKTHSYRELPQRYANTTMCYRDEQTGELLGISRTRSITQDDAHVFCRYSQVENEVGKIWDIVSEFYGTFGYEIEVRLSLHDPREPDNYLGSSEMWKQAEDKLRAVVTAKGVRAKEELGEAAFYAPKIDFMTKDSMGREWQVATIQLDINLPERFDLACMDENGKPERIAMVHAAIMGSIERYLAGLIEHLNGAFPLWLAPVQARVLPIGEAHKAYGLQAAQRLKDAGLRIELDDSDETLNKKIRAGKTEKIPYLLVVGDREMEENAVALESRDEGSLGQMGIEELIGKLKREVREKTPGKH